MMITTSKGRTVRLVYTGDPAVQLTSAALKQRMDARERRELKAAQAELPKDATEADKDAAVTATLERLVDAPLPKAWVTVDECDKSQGALVAKVRALNWLEDQEAQGLPADKQILRVIELGLVELAVDGDVDGAKEFLADPRADLVIPLYRAICDLTWGN